MKFKKLITLFLIFLSNDKLKAQPSYLAPVGNQRVEVNSELRRKEYENRINEVLTWSSNQANFDKIISNDFTIVAAKLALRQDTQSCSNKIISLMSKMEPGQKGSGPFGCSLS